MEKITTRAGVLIFNLLKFIKIHGFDQNFINELQKWVSEQKELLDPKKLGEKFILDLLLEILRDIEEGKIDDEWTKATIRELQYRHYLYRGSADVSLLM